MAVDLAGRNKGSTGAEGTLPALSTAGKQPARIMPCRLWYPAGVVRTDGGALLNGRLKVGSRFSVPDRPQV
jgi:hypothetical protein